MYRLLADLYPLCRSITGEGLRATLRRIGQEIPLTIHEVPTGTPVLDWMVPKEWNIFDAYIVDAIGQRVVDFRRHNLHVVNYSAPVRARMSLAELRPHLHSLPDHPDWIPYRTSYYKEAWGFCLSHKQVLALPEGDYEVVIDSTLADGHLSYGECVLPGESEDEILISTHACHPSMANDNLSGIVAALMLARSIHREPHRYTYRFLFVPGTIGAITWLARNEATLFRIKHGLVLAGVGDSGGLTYKRSRRGEAEIDRAVAHVLKHRGAPFQVNDFTPYGYDERQYNSPGFNLPVGNLSRTPFGQYPQYHTSADDLEFVTPAALADAWHACRRVFELLERNRYYLNLSPKGEPQLGRRGLYGSLGGQSDAKQFQLALLWVLNFSDGAHSLLDIAERANRPFDSIVQAVDALLKAQLIREVQA
jgi:aminopeptidase-like protein